MHSLDECSAIQSFFVPCSFHRPRSKSVVPATSYRPDTSPDDELRDFPAVKVLKNSPMAGFIEGVFVLSVSFIPRQRQSSRGRIVNIQPLTLDYSRVLPFQL